MRNKQLTGSQQKISKIKQDKNSINPDELAKVAGGMAGGYVIIDGVWYNKITGEREDPRE